VGLVLEKARNGPRSGPHARNLEVGGCGGRVEAAYDPPEGGERDAVRSRRGVVYILHLRESNLPSATNHRERDCIAKTQFSGGLE
jgi:hypothetical protein